MSTQENRGAEYPVIDTLIRQAYQAAIADDYRRAIALALIALVARLDHGIGVTDSGRI
jgi:hypothetical protein